MSAGGLEGLVPSALQPDWPRALLDFQLSTAVDDPATLQAEIRLNPAHASAFMAPSSRAALEARARAAWISAGPDALARAQAVYEVLAARQGVAGLSVKLGRPGCWLVLQANWPQD